MRLSGYLGAAVSPAVVRLQNALNALGQQRQDAKLLVRVDGVVGPATAAAANRALIVYVVQGGGKIPQNWHRATTSMIAASANDIASYIEQAAGSGQAAAPPSAPPPQFEPGGSSMPYYPQQGYYPPPSPYGYGSRGPTFAPGGLPIDHASVDVKAFVPAQFDHIQLDAGTGLAILAAGLGVILLVTHHRKRA
jgi:hypothetical protein